MRELVGDWGSELNDDDFACALAYVGLGEVQIQEAETSERVLFLWRWSDALVGLHRERDPSKLAAIWRSLVDRARRRTREPVRCRIESPDVAASAAPWLSRASVDLDGVSAAFPVSRASLEAPRWPWRIVDTTGRIDAASAASRYLGLSYVIAGPSELQPAGLLIVDGTLAAARTLLAGELRWQRATMVLLVGHQPEDDMSAYEALANQLESPVLITTPLDETDAIVKLVVETSIQLSHDKPLDVAVLDAARRVVGLPPPLVRCVPDYPDRIRLSRRADELMADLNPLEAVGVAYAIDPANWGHESGNAHQVARLEAKHEVARDQSAERSAPRYLQAWLTPDGEANRTSVVSPNADYQLTVQIGEADPALLQLLDPIGEPALGATAVIDVIVSEPNLIEVPLRSQIALPPSGPSTAATFPLRVREGVPRLELRVTLAHRGRILQSGIIRAAIDGVAPLTFHVDAVGRARLGGLEHRRRFDAALIANHTTDGSSAIVGATPDQTGYLKLDPAQLTSLTQALGNSIAAIAADPERYATLRSEANVDLLRELALRGAAFHRVLTQHNQIGAGLLTAKRVQVVAARAGTYLPIELAYSHPKPRREADLCPHAEEALQSQGSACPSACGAPDADRICPLGFWSTSRVIERQAHRAEHIDIQSDYELRTETVTRKRSELAAPTGAVMAASDRANKVQPRTVDDLEAALKTTFGAAAVARAATWDGWVEMIRSARRPSMLVLLPHHTDGAQADGVLEIGASDALRALEVGPEHVTGDPPKPPSPIVLLLGCATSVAQIPYESFVSAFRDLDAALVISTIATVLGRDAGPVGALLVNELVAVHRGGGGYAGDAMLRVRRNLLLAGKTMVLALTAYGDADWYLVPA